MVKSNYLYHISPIENVDAIVANGIVGTDKFLFKDSTITNIWHLMTHGEIVPTTVRDAIATNQLFLLDKYAIFKVNISSIRGTLKEDNCGEFTQNFQYITNAEITADMVKFVGILPNQLARKCFEPFKNLPIQSYKKSDIQRLNQE